MLLTITGSALFILGALLAAMISYGIGYDRGWQACADVSYNPIPPTPKRAKPE